MNIIRFRILFFLALFSFSLFLTNTTYAEEINHKNVQWTKVSNISTNTFREVIFGNGIFVAIGNENTIKISSDGFSWTEIDTELPKCGTFENITWNGKKFLISGEFYGKDKSPIHLILESEDGVKWEHRTINFYINSMIWDGNRYVAISGSCIYTSNDGMQWNMQKVIPDHKYSFNDIAWNGERYVVVGWYGEVATSNNGVNWITSNVGEKEILYSVTCNEKMFVAVGSGASILTSADGINWAKQQTPMINGTLQSVIWDGNKFIAVGAGNSNTGTGITFSFGDENSPEERKKATFNILLSTDGITWSDVRNETFSNISLNSVTCNNNTLVAVGEYGVLIRSEDGVNWKWCAPQELSGRFSRVIWDGTKYIVSGFEITYLGKVRASIKTSDDGNVWTERLPSIMNVISGMDYNSNKFVAVGYSWNKGLIITSNDGINWSQNPAGLPFFLNDVRWVGNEFIAIGENSLVIRSKDGDVWERCDVKYQNADSLKDVSYNGETYVAIGLKGNILTSSNGSEWIQNQYDSSLQMRSISSFNGKFYIVAIKDNSQILLTSDDGLRWESQTIGFSNNLKYINNIFIGTNWGGKVFASTNLEEWDSINIDTSNGIKDIASNGTEYIAVGDSGTIIKGEPYHNDSSLPGEELLSDWSKTEITSLWNNELNDDKIFKDYKSNITREELTRMTVLVYERINGEIFINSRNNPFSDVYDSAYYSDILKAYELRIVSGVGNRNFNPKDEVTREEMSVILFNLIKTLDPKGNFATKQTFPFNDSEKIDIWAKQAINFLYESNVLSGTGGNNIEPLNNSTREQALLLIYKISEKYNIF